MIKFERYEINAFPEKIIDKGKTYKIKKNLADSSYVGESILVLNTSPDGKTYVKNVLIDSEFHYNEDSSNNLLLHKYLHSLGITNSYENEQEYKENGDDLKKEIRKWILTIDTDNRYTHRHEGPNDPWKWIKTRPNHHVPCLKMKNLSEYFNNHNHIKFEIYDGTYEPKFLIYDKYFWDIELLENSLFKSTQFLLVYQIDFKTEEEKLKTVILGGFHPNVNLYTGEFCKGTIKSEFRKASKQDLINVEIPQLLNTWNFDDGFSDSIAFCLNEKNKQFKMTNPRPILGTFFKGSSFNRDNM